MLASDDCPRVVDGHLVKIAQREISLSKFVSHIAESPSLKDDDAG